MSRLISLLVVFATFAISMPARASFVITNPEIQSLAQGQSATIQSEYEAAFEAEDRALLSGDRGALLRAELQASQLPPASADVIAHARQDALIRAEVRSSPPPSVPEADANELAAIVSALTGLGMAWTLYRSRKAQPETGR